MQGFLHHTILLFVNRVQNYLDATRPYFLLNHLFIYFQVVVLRHFWSITKMMVHCILRFFSSKEVELDSPMNKNAKQYFFSENSVHNGQYLLQARCMFVDDESGLVRPNLWAWWQFLCEIQGCMFVDDALNSSTLSYCDNPL
jgi:hypothetical protein